MPLSHTQSVPPSRTRSMPLSHTRSMPLSHTQSVPPFHIQSMPPSSTQSVPPSHTRSVPPLTSRQLLHVGHALVNAISWQQITRKAAAFRSSANNVWIMSVTVWRHWFWHLEWCWLRVCRPSLPQCPSSTHLCDPLSLHPAWPFGRRQISILTLTRPSSCNSSLTLSLPIPHKHNLSTAFFWRQNRVTDD